MRLNRLNEESNARNPLSSKKRRKKRLGVTLKTPPLQKHQETIGGKEVKKGRKDRKKTLKASFRLKIIKYLCVPSTFFNSLKIDLP